MNPIKLLLALPLIVLAGCEEPALVPKPRAYPKVEFPEKAYHAFDASYCNFTFQYPEYASIERDTLYFDEKPKNPCWFNIYIPAFDSRIHFSYYDIDEENTLDKLKKDAYELAGKHNIKADYIDELPVEKPDGTTGIVFNIEGPVASPFQFYLTDRKVHFLRGALYFNTQTQPDSLAPILDYVKTDVMEMVNTLKWEE